MRALIEQKQAQTALRLEITRESVILGLLEAVELAREQGDPAAMISAAREIGKMLGFYSPPVKERPPTAENEALRAWFEGLSDEELLAIAEGSISPI